jgi:hypothetical protein
MGRDVFSTGRRAWQVAARFVVAHPTALRPLEVDMEKRGIGVLDLVIASTDLASAQITETAHWHLRRSS